MKSTRRKAKEKAINCAVTMVEEKVGTEVLVRDATGIDKPIVLIIIPGEWPSDEILAAKMKSFAERNVDASHKDDGNHQIQQSSVSIFPRNFRLPPDFRTSIFGHFFRTFNLKEETRDSHEHSDSRFSLSCRSFLLDSELVNVHNKVNKDLHVIVDIFGENDDCPEKVSKWDRCEKCSALNPTHNYKYFIQGFGSQNDYEFNGLFCESCAKVEMTRRDQEEVFIPKTETCSSTNPILALFVTHTPLPTALSELTKEYCRPQFSELPLKLVSEVSAPISHHYEWINFAHVGGVWRSPSSFVNCNADSILYGMVVETGSDDGKRFFNSISDYEKEALKDVVRIELESAKKS